MNRPGRGDTQVLMKKRLQNKSLSNTAMQLRKICNHPYLFHPDYDDSGNEQERLRASGKFWMLARILTKMKASGHRVLLFSQMTKALDIVQVRRRMSQERPGLSSGCEADIDMQGNA